MAKTDTTRVGDRVETTLVLELPAGVHIEPHQPSDPYLIPTVLVVEGLEEVTVDYPVPVVKDLGWNDVTLTVLEGSLVFRVCGRLGPGADRVRGTLRYQPCVGGACLPPRTVRWESPLSGTSTYSLLRALAA